MTKDKDHHNAIPDAIEVLKDARNWNNNRNATEQALAKLEAFQEAVPDGLANRIITLEALGHTMSDTQTMAAVVLNEATKDKPHGNG